MFRVFVCNCVCSISDMGELLQCASGHTYPGYLHCREAAGPGTHYNCGTAPDLRR